MSRVKIVDNTIHSAKIFIYKNDREPLFLVLKEPEGLYGFVGGAEDEADGNIINTAKREIREELNLTNKSYHLIKTGITWEFMHTDPHSERFGKKGILHAFLAKYNEQEPIVLNSELDSYEWTTVDGVFKRLDNSYSYLKQVFQRVLSLLEQST